MDFFANGGGSSEGSGDISQAERRNLRCGGGSGGKGLRLTSFRGLGGDSRTHGSDDILGVGGVMVGDDSGGTSIDETRLSRRATLSAC